MSRHQALVHRKCIQTQMALSPLTRHFLKSTAQTLGISVSELARRILDLALLDYAKAGLYRLPPEFTACGSLPVEPLSNHTVPDFDRLKSSLAKRGGASANPS